MLKKFVQDAANILIYYHDDCKKELDDLLASVDMGAISLTTIPVHYDYHGYVKQQIVKLKCWKDVSTPVVVFLDSDTVLCEPCYFRDYIKDPISIYYTTPSDQASSGAFQTWSQAVLKMTNHPMNAYYMANSFPFFFFTKTLSDAEDYFEKMHKKSYDTFCFEGLKEYGIRVTDNLLSVWPTIARVFEEFEYLCWFAKNHTVDDYLFYTGEVTHKKPKLLQYWSHGGITKEIKDQIESILS